MSLLYPLLIPHQYSDAALDAPCVNPTQTSVLFPKALLQLRQDFDNRWPNCKLLEDTWIKYQFRNTTFLCVLLPSAMLTSKIMEFTAHEDSEVAAKSSAVQTPFSR